ncbi:MULTISPECIES: hypothetical protein [unclassified Acinetobacter]|uniref:hypothetical protein n=1 Tax=unclassified Acinetobacter TaxID=196816 RepID=UPI0029348692|nr:MULTISPECIES: hypothetical protein [unclassified Acinetobacter]WOE33270.1 hypothetical protein QSG84_16040 [Acinetobacter sp. SAAs470]WOE36949.1 hypothetical protein QSG86_00845 [Acinetobacter sp. SAAs474]
MKIFLTVLISSSLIVTPGFAQEKTSNTSSAGFELNQVFDIEKFDNMQVLELSRQEMKDTQGAVAPLVAVGIMAGGRFITQKYVTQNIAKSMVQSAGNNVARQNNVWGIMANTRSQASNIARKNNIREFHHGAGQRFTHYHTSNRNGAHVWYGKPR